jgi:RNA polymerase sigma-B factor
LPFDKEFFKVFCEDRTDELKDKVIAEYQYLVKFVSGKFRGRGEPFDDLVQVGMLGLIKAVNNYNSEFDVEFTTYATPMIIGEIRHYFRDFTRIVKLPRRIHELNSKILKVIYEYQQEHQKSPTIVDIARVMEMDEEAIIEAMEAGDSTRAMSLDSPSFKVERSGDVSTQSAATLMDSLGVEDNARQTINKEAIKVAIDSSLDTREQRIVYLRFYENLSQSEIADSMDMSQMHVSRLIRSSLLKLKKAIFT